MITAIIFDCFGVVISDALERLVVPLRDRDPALREAVVEALWAHNRGLITPEESNAQIASLLGLSYDDYRHAIEAGEVKNEALIQYIQTLRPTYKIAMLSNIDGKGLRRRFTQLGLEELFDVVIASSDIGYAKPEARAYQIVAEKLHVVPKECVFIDDRLHYCKAAEAVGMQTICYSTFTEFKSDLEKILSADSQQ